MNFFPPVWLVNGLLWVQTTTGFPEFVNHHGWMWAAGEIIHFMGLCLLMGTIGALDLRLLGIAKGLPLGAMLKFQKWGIAGFIVCMMTGLFFILGNHWSANAYFNNIAFKWKIGTILLGGLNALIFNVTSLARTVSVMGAGARAPLGARIVAASSLTIWVSVIFWGRFLPILGDAF